MPEVGSASIAIIPSFKGFGRDLEQGTSKAMVAAGATGGTAFGDSAGRSAGSKFRSHVKSFAKIAAVGLGLATAGAIKFAGDSIAEARDAQKVGKLTDAVIKSTGKAAKVTAKDVAKLSERLSNKAAIDDELIQSGANVLLTFTKIRNEAGAGNKIFDQGTTAALNMSVALDQDLKSASIQVGKALNDPIKGVTALGRAGVQFSEDQKKAIKKMVESGDTLGAQKIILKELNTQFKGAAKSQANEADKLKVAWGNFKEEIGTQLLPVMDDLARFLRKKGIPAARDFAGWVRDDMIPAVKDLAEDIKPVVEGFKDVVSWVNKLPKPAKIAGLAAVLAGIGAAKIRGGDGGALATAGKVLGLAKPVPVFVTNPGFGGADGPGGKPKPGFVSNVAKVGLPGAALAGGLYGIKKLFDFHRGGDNKPANGLSFLGGGGVNDWLDSKKPDEYNKSLVRMNDAWSKVRVQTDNATRSTQIYDRAFDSVPKVWTTVFNSVNLARDTALIRQYGGMLDGLDGRTVETFIKTTRLKNDIGDSGDPRFGGFRAHGGSMHPGYSYRVGERGPETVTVGARSTVTPNSGDTGGGTFVLEIDGEQFATRVRQIADDRYTANTRHPTGRRR